MGPPVDALLSNALALGVCPEYAKKILFAFHETVSVGRRAEAEAEESTREMREPLSPRELEVFTLVAQGLSNTQISERLFISLSTVKGHNRQIFEKLRVNRRTEAVAKARNLGIM